MLNREIIILRLGIDSVDRTDGGTRAAIDTFFGIDDVFVSTFGDAAYGAFAFARAAGDAVVVYFICHLDLLHVGLINGIQFSIKAGECQGGNRRRPGATKGGGEKTKNIFPTL